jgi:hypothetical protein
VRWAIALTAAVVVVAVVVTELVALPVASSYVRDEVERCYEVEEVEVVGIERPATPRLVIGRARDVDLELRGLVLGELRVEHADVTLPEVHLPWAPGGDDVLRGTAVATVTEDDLTTWVSDRVPLGLDVVVELEAGHVAVGVEPIPARLDLEVEVRDGTLRLAPAGRMPAWFTSLGLDLEFELPEELDVRDLDVRDGVVVATLGLEAVTTQEPPPTGQAIAQAWCDERVPA